MPEYEYEALDQSGKTVTGKIETSSANDALKSLISDGLHVTGIKTPTVEPVDPGLLTENMEESEGRSFLSHLQFLAFSLV